MIVMDVRPAHDGPGAVITTPGHGAQNRGADVVINKPLTIEKLRALMAMTWGLASQETFLA